ncbi:MAG: LysE family transporter [Clostridium baratii]|uniref:LysE family translocator n=1 Tax=Clostridium baratii TaxID=1561 RepID=UPI0006C320BE|nr:LysE family transporter [Clostridium baratii]MBS6007981.1 LysE family transporter [Clostridium baratii]MDU1055259.1 LysE family transporter [Clostridium baratii]MDU4912593.1 LysE family transporter [Clostridium baratii]CUP81360.1 putative threonine efflux protein [Clostridium baratii]
MIHIIKAACIGLVTGIFASVPLGPAGLESVNRSISKGFRQGFKVSIGAIFADYLYLTIINLGLFSILDENHLYKGIFWLISGIVLILFAKHSKNESSITRLLQNSKLGGVLSGFLITFINPVTFSFWLAFSETVINFWRTNGTLFFYVAFLFMLLGSIIWFSILNLLASRGLKLMKKDVGGIASKLLTYVLYIIGICFIIYGFYVLIC